MENTTTIKAYNPAKVIEYLEDLTFFGAVVTSIKTRKRSFLGFKLATEYAISYQYQYTDGDLHAARIIKKNHE